MGHGARAMFDQTPDSTTASTIPHGERRHVQHGSSTPEETMIAVPPPPTNEQDNGNYEMPFVPVASLRRYSPRRSPAFFEPDPLDLASRSGSRFAALAADLDPDLNEDSESCNQAAPRASCVPKYASNKLKDPPPRAPKTADTLTDDGDRKMPARPMRTAQGGETDSSNAAPPTICCSISC